MKRLSIRALTGIILFLNIAPVSAFYYENGGQTDAIDAPKRIIVKLRTQTKPNSLLKSPSGPKVLTPLAELNERYEVTDQQALFPAQIAINLPEGLRNVIILDVPEGTDINAMAAEYSKLDEVEYAHPDYQAQLYDGPNDPLYGHQWALHNIGQDYYHVYRQPGPYNDYLILTSGLADADIDAHEVFANPPDNTKTVVVAIIDTGVDMDHPDLLGRIWINSGEIPSNGLDDDHNGYIDDYCGWDYTASNMIVPPPEDNDPTDEYGHGTHCAGIVAAIADNNEGIAGIIGDCRIMPLKFYPVMLSSYASRAIVYAADNGADVISMSFGWPWPVRILEEALEYARTKGVILCAASGNDEAEYDNYPAAYPQVITVGATNSLDQVTPFSTYGDHLDICAPGQSILSLRADDHDMYWEHEEPYVHIINDIYYLASGTSMACPHVAAVAAYLRSISPGLTPDKVQEILQITADDLVDPYGKGENYPGWDKFSGYGRVNLNNALALAPALRADIEIPTSHEFLCNTVTIFGTADGADFQEYTLEYGQGQTPSGWTQISFSTGAVTNGPLGIWNTEDVTGLYTIRLRVGETNSDQVTVYLANQRLVSIESPNEIDTISTWTTITGNAICKDFAYYRIEYQPPGMTGTWKEIATSSIPVYNAELAVWSVSGLPDGIYLLRLCLFTQDDSMFCDSISTTIQSPFSGDNGWKVSFDTEVTIMPNYGDFDNDGINEIIVGTANGIRFYNPDGTRKTGGIPQTPDYDFRIPIAVGDIDGDSLDDFVAVGEVYSYGKMFAYLSSGLTYEIYLSDVPVQKRLNDIIEELYPGVFLKDVNNDGKDEIMYAPQQCQGCYLYQWNEIYGLRQDAYAPNGIYFSADLDNDGMDEFYSTQPNMICKSDQVGGRKTCFDLSVNISEQIKVKSISAVDIDSDQKLELIVMGNSKGDLGTFWVYAFDEGLQLKPGWPHNTGINPFLVPPGPVFADIDKNGILEYFITVFELNQAHILAWNLDGSPFGGDVSIPILAGTPNPAILAPPVIADIDGDRYPDLIARAQRDVFHVYKAERLVAWDRYGRLLDGWPIIVVPEGGDYLNFGLHFPIIGDLDKDGHTDLIMTTSSNELIFLNFESTTYNPEDVPVPCWRYGRRMNNINLASLDSIVTRVDEPEEIPDLPIPKEFTLFQNYPNPFNASTTIRFSLPGRAEVEFKVINILGQTVEQQNLGNLEAGTYSLSWSARDETGHDLPSGVYFYQITAGEITEAGKMVLLK